MECAYSDCHGELSGPFPTHCPDCRESLATCDACGGSNRTLARFCRRCGERVDSPAEGPFEPVEAARFGHPARVIQLEGQFWTAPVQHRGELWSVSVGGDVWRVAPFRDHAQRVARMPGNVGTAPSIIREAAIGPKATIASPVLLGLGTETGALLDLVSREPRIFYRAEEGERLRRDDGMDWFGPEFKDGAVHFISLRDGVSGLVGVNLATGATGRVQLGPEQPVAGPFRFGGGFGMYSRRSLIHVREGRVHTHPFPPDFEPFEPREGLWGLQAPFGSRVFVAAGDAVYVPGVLSGRPGFLHAALGSGGGVQHVSVPLGEAAFAGDGKRLIVAQTGRIGVYEGGRQQGSVQWPQLAPSGVPYVKNDFWVAQMLTASKYEALLLCSEGKSREFPLRQLPGGELSVKVVAIHRLPGALLVCYCGAQNEMRVAVWEL